MKNNPNKRLNFKRQRLSSNDSNSTTDTCPDYSPDDISTSVLIKLDNCSTKDVPKISLLSADFCSHSAVETPYMSAMDLPTIQEEEDVESEYTKKAANKGQKKQNMATSECDDSPFCVVIKSDKHSFEGQTDHAQLMSSLWSQATSAK